MSSERAVRSLEAVLPPGTRLTVTASDGQDASVSVAGRRLRLRWLSVGWPRQLAEALRLGPRPDIVAARQLSPGARELARREHIGWVDESGAAEISAGTIVISRTGVPPLPLDSKVGWRPTTLAVCEVLLAGCPATVSAVAAATRLSASGVAEALKFLDGEDFLAGDARRGPRSRRYVADSNGLIDAYAAAAERLRSPVMIRAGVLWKDPLEGIAQVGSSWNAASVKWAVTSALSAAVWAPFMAEITPMEVYVAARTPGDLRRVASTAGLKEMGGGRLRLRPFPTPAGATVTTEIRRGLHSVLWPRAYADLRTTGVRGEDAAENLREEMQNG